MGLAAALALGYDSAMAQPATPAAGNANVESGTMPGSGSGPVWHNGSMKHDDAAGAGSDGWITTKVKARLLEAKGVKSAGISVTTEHGVVALSGDVHSKSELKKAKAAAMKVKGVKKVDTSDLKVAG
jgi:hyperosmotically inducible protein